MASRWSVPQIVAVSVVLAVAVLEGVAAVRGLEAQTGLTAPSVSASGIAVTPATDSPSAGEASGATLPSVGDPSATQEPTTTATQTSQQGKGSQPSASAPATGSVTPRQDLAADVAAAANAEREAAGIKPLTYKSCTVPAAWAVHLATVGTLSHNSLTTILATCGGTTTAGENIAVAYTTVADVTAGWMSSSNHQANILNPAFTAIFVGVAQAADGTYYWVEDFTG